MERWICRSTGALVSSHSNKEDAENEAITLLQISKKKFEVVRILTKEESDEYNELKKFKRKWDKTQLETDISDSKFADD